MAEDCCTTFGGRISIEIDDKTYSPTEADIELMPTNREIEHRANQDGSPAYLSRPRLYEADIKFRNPCDLKWDDLLLKCKVNAVIAENDNNRQHIFSGARVVGRPSLNISTGEVTGLRIAGPNYRVVAS